MPCACISPPIPHPNTLNQSVEGRRFITLLLNRIPELQYFARHQGNITKARRYQAAIAAILKLEADHARGKPPCSQAMGIIHRIYPEPQIRRGMALLQNESQMRTLAHLDSNRVQCAGVRVSVHKMPGEQRHANAPFLRYPYGKAIGHTSRYGHPIMAYVGDDRGSSNIFKVYKTNGDGLVLDEVAMLGFPNLVAARKAFLADNPATTFGGIQPCTKETL